MPRKTDGMLFELLPRPTKGEDGQPLLYARPAIGMKYRSAMRYLDVLCKSENPRIRRYMEGTTMHYAPIVKKEVQT